MALDSDKKALRVGENREYYIMVKDNDFFNILEQANQ